MIRFLFWNVCGVASSQERKGGGTRPLLPTDKRYRNLRRVLAVFCLREKIDVLILAESPFEGQINFPDFIEAKTSVKPNAKTNCRLEVYHRNTISIVSTETLERAIIHGMTSPAGAEFLLVSVHLPSPLGPSSKTRKENVKFLVSDIRNKEYEFKNHKTILVGDLNYEPYDEAITDGNYLNAVPTKIVVRQKERVLPHESLPYFYNPMWGHLTDYTTGTVGTYFRKTNDVDCRFWYLPDQVLLRPDLIDVWEDEHLQILSRLGKISLLHQKGTLRNTPNKKKFSDHLPIVFELNL